MTTKRYYSRVPGSTYVHKTFANELGGHVRTFAHGFSDVSDPEHQKELDDLLGKNPLIYTQEVLPEPEPKSQITGKTAKEEAMGTAKSEAEIAAGEAALRGVNGKVQQEVGPVNITGASDVNTSTIDPDIQKAMTTSLASPVGPGADRLAQIRAEAAARNQQHTN